MFVRVDNDSSFVASASLYLKRVDEVSDGNHELNDQSTLTSSMLAGEETIALRASSCDGEYSLAILINEGEYQPVLVVDEKKGTSGDVFKLSEKCSKDLEITIR